MSLAVVLCNRGRLELLFFLDMARVCAIVITQGLSKGTYEDRQIGDGWLKLSDFVAEQHRNKNLHIYLISLQSNTVPNYKNK